MTRDQIIAWAEANRYATVRQLGRVGHLSLTYWSDGRVDLRLCYEGSQRLHYASVVPDKLEVKQPNGRYALLSEKA